MTKNRWAAAILAATLPLAGGTAAHAEQARVTEPTQALPGDLPDFDALSVSADSATDVWVSGFQAFEGASVVVHWDGSTWSQVALPYADSRVTQVLAFSPSDVWAVGSFPDDQHKLVHWNGQVWRRVASPHSWQTAPGLSGTSSSDIWAVATHGNHTVVDHWDGGSWSALPPMARPPHTQSSVGIVSSPGPGDAWSIEYRYNTQTGARSYHVLHWDGSTWTRSLSGPATDASIEGISAISDNDVWVVGTDEIVGQVGPLTEHWDGTSWTRVDTPFPGYLQRVAAVSSSDVWAIGGVDAGDHPRTVDIITAHWDGSTWTQVPIEGGGAPRDYLASLSPVSSNDVWTVGYSGQKSIIRHWDGSAWS